ncbi:unnamed protein product [Adineta ricciae]|uniref:CABIT domain-containing protein n=1 Tax=Adineta ricciae TaxID=249248 RepID=A0A816DE81_ADIRI|nr:unnamed protein product [Adineta ricciae]CAF1633671.1 unnamed protein product [Adineta ricciae]
MHYLLNDQSYYFPSSNDQSYPLQQFLQNMNSSFPIIVRISSSNIHERSIKHFLSRNIPLLLLTTHQFQSILSEYHCSNEGKHRSSISHGKHLIKKSTKLRTMKNLSKSLVTIATSSGRDGNTDDTNDDYDVDAFNTRTIARNLNKKRSNVVPLCRIPLSYPQYFELLNENDQAIEPFHRISDLLIIEYQNDEQNRKVRTEKWPRTFFLRSTCQMFTKRSVPDDGKLSGSADSCYGSLSDLDPQKTPLILNDEKQLLQPGQVITILSTCLAYRSPTGDHESPKSDSSTSQSSTTSWLRTKSRFFFPRKKLQQPSVNPSAMTTSTRNIYDVPKISQSYLKCQTEQGDIVYISIDETGLFSPVYTPKRRYSFMFDPDNVDVSGVFQLKQLLSNFRFPISVRLLNHSVTFDHIYSSSKTILSETPLSSSTKFRLLLPYTEQVIFACPLIIPSSLKSHTVIIPIPIDSEIEVQRCINMHEITKTKSYQRLLDKCSEIINQYQTELSYIHFPLVLSTPSKIKSSQKDALFKKRSQSEPHIDIHPTELSRGTFRKSYDMLSYDEDHQLDPMPKDPDQTEKVVKQSSYYSKIKIDKPRKNSRQQECDSDDENYHEVDQIYDYIRSGDVTIDVQKIQAKEQALNARSNQMENISRVCVSAVLNVPNTTTKSPRKQLSSKCNSAEGLEFQQFPSNMDDSRPIDTIHDPTDSSTLKPILRMSRINKH